MCAGTLRTTIRRRHALSVSASFIRPAYARLPDMTTLGGALASLTTLAQSEAIDAPRVG
jgi:hypothetical protein